MSDEKRRDEEPNPIVDMSLHATPDNLITWDDLAAALDGPPRPDWRPPLCDN